MNNAVIKDLYTGNTFQGNAQKYRNLKTFEIIEYLSNKGEIGIINWNACMSCENADLNKGGCKIFFENHKISGNYVYCNDYQERL